MAANATGIAAVRRFNRFYTRQIGLLDEHFSGGPFSLAEGRVLYEIAHQADTTATAIANALGIDAGYLSRILTHLMRRGLVTRRRSATDARRSHLNLTPRGRASFRKLNATSQRAMGRMLGRVAPSGQDRLISAMRTIEDLLADRVRAAAGSSPVRLRDPRPGDLGWVVERHGTLYADEYGWTSKVEALAAEVVASFVAHRDAEHERGWIAERGGERVGCVFLMKKTRAVAQLRLLIVEPAARGLGVGRRLVSECTQFARRAGYRRIVLWTNRALDAARHIYQAAGYRLVGTERHDDFGADPVFEIWELKL
jgi:DNA-binding MarR family transcriptional regulator/GNAT superfamily N-acetyltransferase